MGAAKSGTSSLYHHLRRHPGVFMPDLKEPWFFTFAGDAEAAARVRPGHRVVTEPGEYADLFRRAREDQLRGEGSTVYLYQYRRTIDNIVRLHPRWRELKIVALLRDPVARAFSHYLNALRDGRVTGSFEHALAASRGSRHPNTPDFLAYGRYYRQIEAYKDRFHAVQVHLFEDLRSHPRRLVAETCGFLGIDSDFDFDPYLRANPSGAPRNRRLVSLLARPHPIKDILRRSMPSAAPRLKSWALGKLLERPALDPQLEAELRRYYRDDVLRLQDLVDRDLSSWLP